MIEPVYDFNGVRIFEGDALTVLRTLDSASVNCCVTSPPYWGLRDYGTVRWEGGDPACEHRVRDARTVSGGEGKQYTNAGSNRVYSGDCECGATRIDSQMGLESTPAGYVCGMVAVFEEVRRVLREDGTLWLNLGDSYADGGRGSSDAHRQKIGANTAGAQALGRKSAPEGLKPKDLVGIPWLLAFALRADGWFLRSDIIWHKPNPMPESVTDRPTKSHEYLFLLSKSEKYYYDHLAIREPATESSIARWAQDIDNQEGSDRGKTNGKMKAVGGPRRTDKQRVHSRRRAGFNDRWDAMTKEEQAATGRNKRSVWTVATKPFAEAHFATFPPSLIRPCILAGCPEGGTILDPFFGAGTTGLVAKQERRQAVGIELNPEYICIAERRLQQGSLFT